MKFKKALASAGICTVSAIIVLIVYKLLGTGSEDFLPVVSRLSSEQLSEIGYGEKETLDLWDETFSETSVSNEEISETAAEVVFPLDINSASAEELILIKGIGESTANNIISYRENHGCFYSLEELLNVNGIGKKKLETLKNFIYIDETLTSAAQTVSERESTETCSAETDTVSEIPEKAAAAESFPDETEEEYEEDTELTEDFDDRYFTETETTVFTEKEYCPDFPLELNTAAVGDLICIDGIGETLAQRIVEYAVTNGFYEVEELLNISGIGEKKLESIAPFVYADSSALPPREEYTDMYTEPVLLGTAPIYAETPQVYSINVNTASKADFMQLPGIDETTAENLVRLREDISGFEKIEELIFAEGMTTDKLAAILDYVFL